MSRVELLGYITLNNSLLNIKLEPLGNEFRSVLLENLWDLYGS